MQITLGQACEELAASVNAYGSVDVKKSINKALRALVRLHPLKCFRKIVRFTSAGPGFVLPQGSAGLVRACVNGRPVTMRGQDFRFMLSGPGDMDRPPFSPVDVSNILDLGFRPVMFAPSRPFRVFAFVEGEADQPAVTVRGYSPQGKEIVVRTVPQAHREWTPDASEGSEYGTEIYDPEPQVFQEITKVTIDKCATKYVTLCAVDWETGYEFAIGVYNPRVAAPVFRHYELPGWPEGHPVEILAEVRMDHIDLIDDDDVLPVDCTDPVEWMIRADWEMKAGETQRADNYRKKAEEWLQREEQTTHTVQTRITVNSEYYGSPGEISADAANI